MQTYPHGSRLYFPILVSSVATRTPDCVALCGPPLPHPLAMPMPWNALDCVCQSPLWIAAKWKLMQWCLKMLVVLFRRKPTVFSTVFCNSILPPGNKHSNHRIMVLVYGQMGDFLPFLSLFSLRSIMHSLLQVTNGQLLLSFQTPRAGSLFALPGILFLSCDQSLLRSEVRMEGRLLLP